MEVDRTPFDHRSELDENGMYDYIYVGAYYTFKDSSEEIVFAWYEDEPKLASLKDPIDWRPDVYASLLFHSAVEYLRNEGVDIIKLADPTPSGRGFILIAEAIKMAELAGLPVPIDSPYT